MDPDIVHWFKEALSRGWIPVDSVTGFFIIVPSLPTELKVMSVLQLRDQAKSLGTHEGVLDALLRNRYQTIWESKYGFGST